MHVFIYCHLNLVLHAGKSQFPKYLKKFDAFTYIEGIQYYFLKEWNKLE